MGDTPGYFRIVLDGTVVGNSRNDLSENTIIAKLDKGDLVQVTEVITCEDIARVRAKVEKPDGWISLKSMKTGKRWAVKEDSPPQDDGTTAKTTCEAEEDKTESTANTAEASASNTKRTSQTSTKDVEFGNQDVCEKEVLAKKEKKEKKVKKEKKQKEAVQDDKGETNVVSVDTPGYFRV